MRMLAVIPMLTAVLAAWCALWPAARRFAWPMVALAAVNVITTPFSSGEWSYQNAEDPAYQQAVGKGDFEAFDRLVAQHDPYLFPRMIAMALVLLAAVVGLAVLQHRSGASRSVSVVVLLAAAATLVQCGLLLVA